MDMPERDNRLWWTSRSRYQPW